MPEEFILYKQPHERGFTLCKGSFSAIDPQIGFTAGIVLSTFLKDRQLGMMPISVDQFNSAAEALVGLQIELDEKPDIDSEDTSAAYIDLVNKGIQAIAKGDMQKVVLARSLSISLAALAIGISLDRLATANSNSLTYLLYSEEFGYWLGATPELLLLVGEGKIQTMALAGTRKQGLDADFTGKDYAEHAIVSDEIVQILTVAGYANAIVVGPNVHSAGSVTHLMSAIHAPFQGEVDHFRLANRLHPTSAVSGYPRKKAMAFILGNEGLERALYSGFIGIAAAGQASSRKATYYVNLRCGRLGAQSLTLFAGAGIVDRSVAEDELAETNAKMAVLQKPLKPDA